MTAPMNDTPEQPPQNGAAKPAGGDPAARIAASITRGDKPTKVKEEENFFVFLIKLVLIVGIFRSFIFSPFNIPSESMLPRLENGDYLLAAKWPYGFSKYSMPFSLPLIPGRIFAGQPKRGDVVIFKAPPGNDVDYIKRVIGLPGDRVEVHDNVVSINGVEARRTLDGDYNYLDHSEYTDTDISVSGTEYSEDLIGKRHKIIVRKDPDYARSGTWTVPAGAAFMMGDNRDNSSDSRVEGGIGPIPFSYIKGRASLIWLSFGGSAGVRFERLFHPVD